MSDTAGSRLGAMGPWLRKKIVDPFVKILRRGAEPKQLAFSTALGISLGVFPIVGVTVFLCGLAIAVLGSSVNAPTVMLANFIATPLELSLMIVFLRFGEFIMGGGHFPLTSDALKKVLTGEASMEIFRSLLHAVYPFLACSRSASLLFKVRKSWGHEECSDCSDCKGESWHQVSFSLRYFPLNTVYKRVHKHDQMHQNKTQFTSNKERRCP